jgi:hypothetical protein
VFTFAPGFVDTYTYAWTPADFIAGQETLPNPNATAVTATTTYTVVVTSSIGCSSTSSTTITTQSGSSITTQPIASAVCVGQTATFSVTGLGSGLTYQWFKNGAAISGNASATTATLTLTGVTLANSGSTYYVVITPSCGATTTSNTVTLTVNPLPTATISGTAAVCLNGTSPVVTITGATGTAPYTFTYKIGTGSNQTIVSDGAGIATINAPTNATGTFTYTLVSVVDSSSTACTQTQSGTATITVNALPNPVTVTPTGSTTICSGATPVLLTAGGGGTTPSAYCIPAMGTVQASGDYLNNFSFAGIVNNNSGDTATDYTYYSSLTATVVAGTAYPVSLQAGGTSSTYAQQFRIWVDMNQNGVFESTESVFNSSAATFSPTSTTGNITIPTTALNGTTRMRVMSKYSSTPLNTEACSSTGSYGEYEDYNITISGGTDPAPLAVWTSTNGGLYTNTTGTAYNGTTSRSTIYASPTATGTVTATVTNAAGCTASGTVSFTVNALPSTPTISASGATTFCEGGSVTLTASAGSSYLWSNGAATQSISVTATGDYSVQVINAAGCFSASSTVTRVTVNSLTTSSTTISACGSYTWSATGLTYTTSGDYTNIVGCNTETLHLTINICSSVVTVKMNIQGYYNTATHAMRPVLANQGVGSSTTNVDNVTIQLRDASTNAVVATTTAMLQTNGDAVATFTPAVSGSYYIAVKHRNALETWSATPQMVGATPSTYNFTDAASKAYGSNMVAVDGKFAFYSGDINQDGFIEATDYDQLNADNDALLEGFYPTDLNGDGFVEALDYDIINLNSDNLIEASRP